MNERFRKPERIRKKKEFQNVLSERCVKGTFCALYIQENGFGLSRLGLVVSRAVGNSVTRNRVKRRLREVFRRLKSQLTCPMDIVIKARGEIRDASYQDIAQEVRTLLIQVKYLDDASGFSSEPGGMDA